MAAPESCAECGAVAAMREHPAAGCVSCVECGFSLPAQILEAAPRTAHFDNESGLWQPTATLSSAPWCAGTDDAPTRAGPRDAPWVRALEAHVHDAIYTLCEELLGISTDDLPSSVWHAARAHAHAHYDQQVRAKRETRRAEIETGVPSGYARRCRQRERLDGVGGGGLSSIALLFTQLLEEQLPRARYRHSLAVPAACAIALAVLQVQLEDTERRGILPYLEVRQRLSLSGVLLSWTSVTRVARTVLEQPEAAFVCAFVARCRQHELREGVYSGVHTFPVRVRASAHVCASVLQCQPLVALRLRQAPHYIAPFPALPDLQQ